MRSQLQLEAVKMQPIAGKSRGSVAADGRQLTEQAPVQLQHDGLRLAGYIQT
jgi:hypothetical protein